MLWLEVESNPRPFDCKAQNQWRNCGGQGPRLKNRGPIWGLLIQKSKILLCPLLLTGTQSCVTMDSGMGSYGPYGPIVTPLNITFRKQNRLIFTSIEQ